MHLIVTCYGKMIEIQVRTQLQHLWADLSEKYSDVVDRAIKYGGGEEEIRGFLADLSDKIGEAESSEERLANMRENVPRAHLPEYVRNDPIYVEANNRARALKQDITRLLKDALARMEGQQGGTGAFLN